MNREQSSMRNFALKVISGFEVVLENTVRQYCPEAEAEIFRTKYNLAEMKKRILEANAAMEPAPKRKMKRINVT